MDLLLAVTVWQRFGLVVGLALVGIALAVLAVGAFLRGARAEDARRREQDAQNRAAGEAALRQSRALWQSRSEYESDHPPVGGGNRAA